MKCLQQIGILNELKYPEISSTIKNDFYVDDLLTGAHSVNEATIKQTQLRTILSNAGFELRKWISNCEKIVKNVPADHRATKVPLKLDQDETIKTLGLYWHPTDDVFQFKICLEPITEQLTKRSILSDVAKLFDPNSWIAPVTIKAKILLQSLWLTGLYWDDKLPTDLINNWSDYRGQLKTLEKLKIPRWLQSAPVGQSLQLHCFTDASIQAYAAVVYLRIVNPDGTIITNFKNASGPNQTGIIAPFGTMRCSTWSKINTSS